MWQPYPGDNGCEEPVDRINAQKGLLFCRLVFGRKGEIMKFSQAARNESVFTRTENGAVALKTTSDARLDLFGVIGSLRGAEKVRIERLFSEAYHEDFAARKRSASSASSPRRIMRILCSRPESPSTPAMSAGDWASAKLSGLSSATWRRCIRGHCVRTWI